MPVIRKLSKWRFETSESKSIAVSYKQAAAQWSKGKIHARSPSGGVTKFGFTDLGVGVGKPFKVDIFPKGKIASSVSGTVSLPEDPSGGQIYILDGFRGDELTANDFVGACLFAEASVGLYLGYTLTAMLLGIASYPGLHQQLGVELVDFTSYVTGLAKIPDARRMIQRLPGMENAAKAVVFFGGKNHGHQSGASIITGTGAVWIDDVESTIFNDGKLRPVGLESEIIRIRTNNKQQEEMIIPADALFDSGLDTLGTKSKSHDAIRILSRLASILRSKPSMRITLTGHTDSQGSMQYNQGLSERRAARVHAWLIREGGISPGRFKYVKGYGETEPIAPNNNPAGRAKNRRVEITLWPD